MNLGDLYEFNLHHRAWRELGTAGLSPAEDLSFFSVGTLANKLFLFGGYTLVHVRLNSIYSIEIPSFVEWDTDSGPGFLAATYDWDTVTLPASPSGSAAALLPWKLSLCTGALPCALLIQGGGGMIRRSGEGSVVCLSSAG